MEGDARGGRSTGPVRRAGCYKRAARAMSVRRGQGSRDSPRRDGRCVMRWYSAGVCSHARVITVARIAPTPCVRDAVYAASIRYETWPGGCAARRTCYCPSAPRHFAEFIHEQHAVRSASAWCEHDEGRRGQAWLGIKQRRFPGAPALSLEITQDVMTASLSSRRGVEESSITASALPAAIPDTRAPTCHLPVPH